MSTAHQDVCDGRAMAIRHSKKCTEFPASTFFGSPTSIDVFEFHSSSRWSTFAFQLVNHTDQANSKGVHRSSHVSDDEESQNLRHAFCHNWRITNARQNHFEILTDDMLLQIVDLIDVRSAVFLGKTSHRNRSVIRCVN